MDVGNLEKSVTFMHQFLTDWIGGNSDNNEAELARFKDLMDPRFNLINPDASVSSREMILEQLANIYGKVPGVAIDTRGFTVVAGSGDLVVATYEELQRWSDAGTSRRSTVLFEAQADAPYGYRWLHAQETWIDATSAGPQ